MDYVHYTNSIDSLNGILKNGLLINPLKRNLIHLFSQSPHYKDREPQEFGMTSLRQEGGEGSKKHINHFGSYGVSFTDSWVISKDFKPVIYLRDSTEQHIELMQLYKEAEEELIQCIDNRPKDDAFPLMAYTNKNVAGLLGANKYVDFLNIYEFLEPYKHIWQSEIRHVQKDPMYINEPTKQLVENISSPGWCNIIMTLKFNDTDVSHFITSNENQSILKDGLPTMYQGKEVQCKNFV